MIVTHAHRKNLASITAKTYSVGRVLDASTVLSVKVDPIDDEHFAFVTAKNPDSRGLLVSSVSKREYLERPPLVGDILVCREALTRDFMTAEEYDELHHFWESVPR